MTEIIDEMCECDHLQSRHGEIAIGEIAIDERRLKNGSIINFPLLGTIKQFPIKWVGKGHGACLEPECKCKQFTCKYMIRRAQGGDEILWVK